MKRYNKDILPFGAICRAWRMRCKISAPDMARIIGIKNPNDIYQFENGYRVSWYILSGYIKAGCDITFELTLSNVNYKKCGDCKNSEKCKFKIYAISNVTEGGFSEVIDGCKEFERKSKE